MNGVKTVKEPYFKKILLFALPLMLSGIFQSLYVAADLVVVGRFEGDVALAAVGSTGSLTSLILGLFLGLAVGGGVCVAHGIGANDSEDIRKTVHTSILLAAIMGIAVAILGFFLAPWILRLMETPEDVLPLASTYIKIIFLGSPALVIYNYAAAMLRASGDSKRPLIFLTVSGVVNIVLNLLFVAVLGMGVVGVALGTIIAQMTSAVMVIIHMRRIDGPLHLSLRRLSIDAERLKKILRIGIPSGIQGVLLAISNVTVQSSINSFGSAVVAGNSAAANVERFYYIAYHSFYDASITFVGQAVGAKKFERIKRIVLTAMLCVVIFAVVLSAIGLIFAEPLLKMYIPDNKDALDAATLRFTTLVIPYFLCGFMEITVGTLRGMGRSMSSTVITLIFACVLRILWIATVFKVFTTPLCIYMTYPISWILTTIVGGIMIVVAVKKEIKHSKIIKY